MYAPIYLPKAAPPSPEVLAAEARILDTEGAYHVEGRYYASRADADWVRRIVAERLVREAKRREAWYARHRAEQTASAGASRVRAVAWLTARERSQVEAAAGGLATITFADTLPAVANTLKGGLADAVLVSVSQLRPAHVAELLRMIRGFPGVVIAGLVSEVMEAQAIAGTLLLGRAGVAVVFDCRDSGGWSALRALLRPDALPRSFGCCCVAAILDDLQGQHGEPPTASLSDGLRDFFAAAFAPDLTSTKQLSTRLGVRASTLASRFFRAGLPSPKRYLAFARLVWAAHLGETPGLSISAIAERLDASSPQAFHRTVRTLTGRSAVEFRRMMTGDTMLEQFRTTLVAPYRDALRAFDPLGVDSVSAAHTVRPTLQLGRVA